MSKYITKVRPHLNFGNFLITSTNLGFIGGTAIAMNEASREKDATLGNTCFAGILGGVTGGIGGGVFAFGWPIIIAAAGFNTLNKPPKTSKNVIHTIPGIVEKYNN